MSNIIEGLFSLVDKITAIYPTVAVIVFGLVILFDRQKLEIKLDGVAKFIAVLVILGAIKICLWDGTLTETNPYDISMKNFLFVFLEDAFYVMVPFYLTKFGSRRANIVIWVFFSLVFGIAHRYQGVFAIFVTAVYPYFISNRFAKTSFGTVMACHFLWDCFVLSLPKINNLLHLAEKYRGRMETTEERWLRWDGLINEKKYIQLIKEFDLLYAKKVYLTMGDLVRRDEALEFVGISSIVKERVKRQEVKLYEFRRGKS